MEDLYKEMQELFSDCSVENGGKVRSSIVIEAITIKYGLNEELKNALISKLDPENIDLLYAKDDLFSIFKDWIICTGFGIDAPIQSTSSYKSFIPLCSVSTPVARSKKLLAHKLVFNDSLNLECDEGDGELLSHNSSSAKKKLIYHRSILESRLQSSELHADSLEKKYETVNDLCEKQKLEIERLKQELKTHREMEHAMEEMSECRRKEELKLESKLIKIQTEFASACCRIEFLESMEINLKQELLAAQESAKKWEVDLLIGMERVAQLEFELTQKNEVMKELEQKVSTLNMLNDNNNRALSILIDEKMNLNNKLNDLQTNIRNASQACVIGVPLCEELPSEMLQFPGDDSFLDSSDIDESLSETCRSRCQVICQGTQTDGDENTRLYICQGTQINNLELFEMRLISCQGTQTNSKLETSDLSLQISPECNIACSQTTEILYICQSSQTEECGKSSRKKLYKCKEIQTCLKESKEKSLQVCSECKVGSSQTNERLFISRGTDPGFNELKIKRFFTSKCWRFVGGTVITVLTVLIALFAVFLSLLHYCQNNQCLQLRYAKGPPPV